ncbi:MAG: formylglycine-generating enzyme family protein [bacterium]|nr:formylglycine-generating enzyme family protein [bacterium]
MVIGNINDYFPPEWASEWGEDQYGLWAAFIYKGVLQRFRRIHPGTFKMGSPGKESTNPEPERYDDETLHEVTLDSGFWLADTACTQELWQAVTRENPSRFKGPQLPVESVSWNDCRKFIDTLNGLIPGPTLRLPTEAQWEYAWRSGTDTPFSFGENITPDQVNYNGNYPYDNGAKGAYRKKTVEVKELPHNKWGLYQMHGNVWEWCDDWYGEYPTESVVNPPGLSTGEKRVIRSASWIYDGRNVQSAYRHLDAPSSSSNFFGFRLAAG